MKAYLKHIESEKFNLDKSPFDEIKESLIKQINDFLFNNRDYQFSHIELHYHDDDFVNNKVTLSSIFKQIKMKTTLVSCTKAFPVENKSLSPEELIVYIARVSNPSNQLNTETADKLISYLIKNKHWSPFEMVDMTVEIVTSRAIAQQILRHRSFSFQEFSQRYADAARLEEIELRMQANKNRQSSTDKVDMSAILELEIGAGVENTIDRLISDHFNESIELYKALIKHGVAKESARFVLPLCTQTKIYMKGSIRSWIHYLLIRLDEHTQKEHRLIALSIFDHFQVLFPNISKAITWEITE